MLTLGIESSCDETAAAVVLDGRALLSNVVHTQIDIHARYGGVVPELASRNHVMTMIPVVERALEEAAVGLDDLDLIAATRGPGLVGSLLVGLETAKMLAYLHGKPLAGVNHLEGHLLSPFIDSAIDERFGFPYVALVVSGGHTSLFHVRDLGKYKQLGRTLDDAAGEAFDKVAKRLGADYPGGPYIEKVASKGNRDIYPLPIPMLGKGLNFSYSGLKTAAATLIAQLEEEDPERAWVSDLCAGLQHSIVESLVRKASKAVDSTGCRRLVISGGVACNSALRQAVGAYGEERGVEVVIPGRSLCTDNAAMIACAGALHYLRTPHHQFGQYEMDVDAAFPIGGSLFGGGP